MRSRLQDPSFVIRVMRVIRVGRCLGLVDAGGRVPPLGLLVLVVGIARVARVAQVAGIIASHVSSKNVLVEPRVHGRDALVGIEVHQQLVPLLLLAVSVALADELALIAAFAASIVTHLPLACLVVL